MGRRGRQKKATTRSDSKRHSRAAMSHTAAGRPVSELGSGPGFATDYQPAIVA